MPKQYLKRRRRKRKLLPRTAVLLRTSCIILVIKATVSFHKLLECCVRNQRSKKITSLNKHPKKNKMFINSFYPSYLVCLVWQSPRRMVTWSGPPLVAVCSGVREISGILSKKCMPHLYLHLDIIHVVCLCWSHSCESLMWPSIVIHVISNDISGQACGGLWMRTPRGGIMAWWKGKRLRIGDRVTHLEL